MSNKYAGTDILDTLRSAKNYNNFLVNQVIRFLPNSVQITDFGAGIGTFASRLRMRGLKVSCVESDEEQFIKLREKKFSATRNLQELANESLSYIYTLNVLEHIQKDDAVLKELYAKLKPRGRLLIYVPALQILFSGLDKRVGHYRRYSKKGLAKKLKDSRFEIRSIKYVDSLGFFAALVYRWAGPRTGDLTPTQVWIYDRFLFPLSRIFDIVLHPFFGKNLLALAIKK